MDHAKPDAIEAAWRALNPRTPFPQHLRRAATDNNGGAHGPRFELRAPRRTPSHTPNPEHP